MLVCVRRLSMIGVMSLVISGCSSPDSTPANNAPPAATPAAAPAARDACSLITADEAAKILGSPVKLTPRSGSQSRTACDYVSDAYESFTLEVAWSGAGEELKTARSAGRIAASQAGGQDQVVNDVIGSSRVENLGDEAYFSRRTMSYVRKGDVLLIFQNAGLNEPAREHWEALARAALARL